MIIRSNIVLIVVSSLLGMYWLARWYEHTNHEEHATVQTSFADKTISQNKDIEKIATPIVKITAVPSREIVPQVTPKLAKAISEQESTALPSPTDVLPTTAKRKSKTVVLTLSSDPGAKKENSEEESHEEKVATDDVEETQIKTQENTEKTAATDNVVSEIAENTPATAQESKQQDKNTDVLVEQSPAGFITPTLQSPDPEALSSIKTDTAESQLTTSTNSNKPIKPAAVAERKKTLTAQQLLQKTTESKLSSETENPEVEKSELENPEAESTKQTASYRINKGDTLYALARRFNTTIDTLKEINGLRDNTIHVGERIRYPHSN